MITQITTLPELDIFSIPPTQLSIERNFVTEHRPISVLDSNSIIEFNITPPIDEYLQLRDMLFYLKLRVDLIKTGNVVEADWKKVGVVNNFLHSIFRSVDLEINGKSVTMSPQTYAYKAYFETTYGYTQDAQISHLTASGYFIDDEHKEVLPDTQMEFLKPGGTINATGVGKHIELIGKLHLDLCQQPKALIGGTKLKITLVPNEPKFYLWAKDNTINPKVTFENAALYVTRSKLTPKLVESQNTAILKGTAKYPIDRSNVKSFTINAGQSDVIIDNAINGQIPRRIIVALVSNQAYTGNLQKNPFNFQHFDLNYLTANIDGVQYPTVAYKPDFINKLYIREFLSVFEAYNQLTTDTVISMDRNTYDKGNTIYGFNFALDGTDECYKVGYVNPIRHGSLGLHLKFRLDLPEAINVIMYCEYDNLIQIDANRDVVTDYV